MNCEHNIGYIELCTHKGMVYIVDTELDITEMPIIKNFWYEQGSTWGYWSKVGKHSRVTNNKRYESPRIILPREFNKYIGRRYYPFHTLLDIKLWFEVEETDAIMIVFMNEGNQNE